MSLENNWTPEEIDRTEPEYRIINSDSATHKCKCGDDAVSCLDGELLCKVCLVANVFEHGIIKNNTVIPDNNLITGIELRRKLMGVNKSTLSKAFDAGYNTAIEEIIKVIKETIRTEIRAFAEAMEAEMRKKEIDNAFKIALETPDTRIEIKDNSWKDCEIDVLEDGMGEVFEQWWNNYEYGYDQDKKRYLDIANYAMMLWHRAKE